MFEHFKYTRSLRGCQLALPGSRKTQAEVETYPLTATLNLDLRYLETLRSIFTLGANTPEPQRSGQPAFPKEPLDTPSRSTSNGRGTCDPARKLPEEAQAHPPHANHF